jgi:hypothetical protein
VRLYYGDPYGTWDVTLQVEGGTPVQVNNNVDRYGFITATGTDANNDGVLDITILGGIWVAGGLDVALASPTRENLPTPATTTGTLAASQRLQFAASTIGSPWQSALGTYNTTNGFGWSTPVSSFVRPASMFPPGYSGDTAFYGSAAWGQGSATFAIAVPLTPAVGTTYSIRAYLSDPYTNWSGITLQGETGPSTTVSSGVVPATTADLLNLTDANGDGLITFTVTGPVWVLNGVDFVTGTSFPTAP